MHLNHSPLKWAAVMCMAFAGMQACAQPAPAFQPEVGQEGKDVVWVPTSQALVNKMLDMAKLTAKDIHYDLGSGDGRTVITAAKRGARSYGIEYNPEMVTLAQQAAAKEGVSERGTFAKADLFETDFSKATVLTLFLLPTINEKLKPKILDMQPGTRVVSNTFTMGDWEADETGTAATDQNSSYYRTALLWIVPAKVDGQWRSATGDFTLKQVYQKFTGSMSGGSVATVITGGKLNGDQISFSAGGAQYVGTVSATGIYGTVTAGGSSKQWSATRP